MYFIVLFFFVFNGGYVLSSGFLRIYMQCKPLQVLLRFFPTLVCVFFFSGDVCPKPDVP